MILKKVKITNYRQLQNVELDMQDSLTVLAGPNNSGKTTLISVLKGMFCDKKLSFNYSDIPIQLSSDWLDKILPIFQAVMIKYDRESGVREIIKKIMMISNILQIILWIWMTPNIHFILSTHMNQVYLLLKRI